jgi:hypothetical protein
MSDVQKLKELMARYHAVTQKQKFDNGGVVSSDDKQTSPGPIFQ